ncbi:translocation/assembly module TamB domain-containing protein [Aliiroseovarius sp. S1123]|uniref:translocation/assembly module TamB domain-containing protein n=1 Tax=Aliiroseovarius sp. S1123 TaxID=2926404 RepID=UPI001FF3C8D3|nr:translocation/assembly module TamB domain-containing protein [Aliiroseovarius sp. S1123]MCK0170495.1 translocation/assembly module TamB domain-containing protein [Aliiroseovarius sp. S1123]
MWIHRFLLTLIAALSLPLAALSQNAGPASADDRGYLQAFLEDNLSDTGREIKIIGFQGAFSSQATVDEITVADGEGIWLSLRGLTLTWTRSALLTGNVKIDALEAEEITLSRRPIPDPSLPAPEATGFALPELPVSLNIGTIRAARVHLGEGVIGEAAEIALQGSAALEAGDGNADLTINRLDGPKGALELKGSYNNTDRILSLFLSLQENTGGMAATLLGIPNQPALDLTLDGTGPLSDFEAQIALATEGEPRLTGHVRLTESAVASAQPDTPTFDRQYALDLSGDISPLLHPDFKGFFGDAVDVTTRASQLSDGSIRVDTLSVQSNSLDLKGDLMLAPGGWPERIALNGRIASPDGAPVHLPLSGPRTMVSSAHLTIAYDAATGELWTARAALADLTQGDLIIDAATLSGSGQLRAGAEGAAPLFDGAVRFDVKNIQPTRPEFAAAIGTDLTGALQFNWQSDDVLAISNLKLAGDDYDLTGDLTLTDFADGVIARSNGLRLDARDLSQFSGLAATPLLGRVTLDLTGESNLLGGAFDLRLNGRGAGLGVNQPQLDAVIGGKSILALHAVRDMTGTRIKALDLETEKAQISASADLKTKESAAELSLNLPDASAVDPKLNGPARLTASLQQTGTDWRVETDFTGPGGASLQGAALVRLVDGAADQIDGTLRGDITQLAPYSGLAQRALSGSLNVDTEGQMRPETGNFTLKLDAKAASLGIGIAQVDALLRGDSTLSIAAHREGDAPILLDRLTLRSDAVSVTAEGAPSDNGTRVTFQSRLADLGLIADGILGPAEAQGSAELTDETWRVAMNATGPAGVNARVDGTVSADGTQANLALSGTAPLALANQMIRPRLATGTANYDLALQGPLDLASVSGTMTTQNARIALPRLKQAIDINSGRVTLAGGVATLDIQSSVAAGGRIAASGTIGMAAPMQADLSIQLDQLRLTDGALFETIANGSADLRGPLQGGATLRAVIDLGRTELRVPEAAPGTLPVMEGLRHVGEPAAVRQTRQFAGLIVEPSTSATGRPYPLDITLNAPGQVFVRGRGLDAELGGSLRVTGTSADVIPQGEFSLIRGRLDMLGKRLTLTEGDVSLQGDFNAYLRFLAEARAEDTDIKIGVTGPVSEPEITFTSSPELPEDEVLARLLFGKDITQISAIQALRLAAAVRTLAGKGGEGVLGRLRGSFALDDLDVTTDETGAASVRAGKYISENIYTDVTVGADGTAEVNLNLTLSPSLTARGSLGSDGETGLGVYFERDY